MFWKKKKEDDLKSEADKKHMSPKDRLTQKFEMLKPEEELSYLVSETFGGWLATVKCNPQYPKLGKRFVLYTETPKDGKMTGKRRLLWESNKAKDMATWVSDRQGVEVPPQDKAA